MNATKTFFTVILLLVLGLGSASIFIVDETKRSIVMRLGQLKQDDEGNPLVYDPGLHFKMPFLDQVRPFDRRIRTLQLSASRIPTSEKKILLIDLYTMWRIEDFATFFKSTRGSTRVVERLLSERMVDVLRAEIGRRELNAVVSTERQKVMKRLFEEAKNAATSLGLKIIDLRVARIDLPPQTSEAVFNLMRSERQRIAAEHRARGRSKAEIIKANADAKVTIIKAEAERDAQFLRGQGDATAARIYSDVYSQDPEFYSFYRSLEAYRATFSEQKDMLVLKPDSDFFKFFHGFNGAAQKNSKERD